MDEAARRRQADAAARARAEAHVNSCESSASASCGHGASAIGRSIDLRNRAEVDKQLARLETLEKNPSASPTEHAWLKSQEGSLRAAARTHAAQDQAAAADRKRIEGVIHPERKPDSIAALTTEIVRLRSVRPDPKDTSLSAALKKRVGELVAAWTQKATAEGIPLPGPGFDPYRASDAALRGAFLWTQVTGAAPLTSIQEDGGQRFKEDVFEALALRTPGLDEQLLDSYRGHPSERILLEGELARLGDAQICRPDTPIDALRLRRAELVNKREAYTPPDGHKWMGLDGVQGTFEQLVDYEIQQRIIAMNPGSGTGVIAAGIAASSGADTNTIRAAGQLGNSIEGAAGAVAGVDPKAPKVTLKGVPQNPSQGRRRERLPGGPGLGRRTRNAGGAVPRRGVEAGAGVTAKSRTPNGLNDKHFLGGEVRGAGTARAEAQGFHLESAANGNARVVSGTKTKCDRFGVYQAAVEIKDPTNGTWLRKHARSTFFPEGWSRSEVRTAVLEAFANRRESGNGTWEGTTSKGMTIRGHSDANGVIDSAYPTMEN